MRNQGPSISKQRADYNWRNQEAARVILANVERHGGEQAALVQWARISAEQRRSPKCG